MVMRGVLDWIGYAQPASGEGVIKEEDCPTHKHVEWTVSYEAIPKSGDLLSPVFRIKRQRYVMQLSRLKSTSKVRLNVLRSGPRVNEQPPTVLCWAGLKWSDGTYRHESMVSRRLRLDNSSSFDSWPGPGIFLDIHPSDLEKWHLASDGRVTSIFRMNTDRVPAGAECTHGTPLAPTPPSGTIREEVCSTHTQVEWDVDYEGPRENDFCQTSPAFEIAPHTYFLEACHESSGGVSLKVYRLGPPVDLFTPCWLALRCGDGSYRHPTFTPTLDMRDDLGLWTPVVADDRWYCWSDLESQRTTSNGRLTFVFRVNVKSTAVTECNHGVPRISLPAIGFIREEACSSHKQVEWDAGRSFHLMKTANFRSPVFEVGNQAFFLDARLSMFCFTVGLYRHGGYDSRSVRWWAGLRLSDGTTGLIPHSSIVDLRAELGLWTKVDGFNFPLEQWDRQRACGDGHLRIFLRMNVDPIGEDLCTHGMPPMPAEVSGSIREDGCSFHKQVEWDVDLEVPKSRTIFLTSPAFRMDSQLYFLHLCLKTASSFSLYLYRLGSPAPGSFRWWAGIYIRDSKSSSQYFDREMDLREDFGLWTAVRQVVYFVLSNSDCEYLRSKGRMTIFFRLNVEPNGEETCTHQALIDHAAQTEGNVRKEDCPSHTYVEWDVAYEPSPKELMSPIFEVGNQKCEMLLSCSPEGLIALEIRCVGCPASPLRCWAGLKRGDGTHHHQMLVAELDFRQDSSLWAQVALFRFSNLPDVKNTLLTSDGHLSVFLRIDRERDATGDDACVHGAEQMYGHGDGTVRQRDDELVEWDVPYEEPREHTHMSTSPAFRMADQCYMLELLYEVDGVLSLSLYRSGCAVQGRRSPVQCWAGLGCEGWTYRRDTKGAELDLGTDSELWTRAAVLRYYRRSDLERRHVGSDRRLTLFLRMDSSDSVDVGRQTEGVEQPAEHADGDIVLVTDSVDVGRQTEGVEQLAKRADGDIILVTDSVHVGRQTEGVEQPAERADGDIILVTDSVDVGRQTEGVEQPAERADGDIVVVTDSVDVGRQTEGVEQPAERADEDIVLVSDSVDEGRQTEGVEQPAERADVDIILVTDSADVGRQTEGVEQPAVRADGDIVLATDYEDQLRQDFRLWLQNPAEGDRIRQRRRAEFEARRRRRGPATSTDDDNKFSISAA